MQKLAVCLALFLCQSLSAMALDVPRLQRRVTDLAGVLTTDQTGSLETKLQELEAADSTQVAVLVIPGLGGENLEDYSIRVAEAWKLGRKGRDNGALLLVAIQDRAIRIETGYGLEEKLTDARASQIIRNNIIPRFRQGDFYGGIDAGVTGIIQTVRGIYQASPDSERQNSRKNGANLNFLIVMLFPLLWFLSATGKWGGGIVGAGAGMLLPYTLISHSLPIILIGGALGGFIGMFIGALIKSGSESGRGSGGFGGPFIPGSGGFSGGGGFGGFSGGGGGFGGGGSSGRW